LTDFEEIWHDEASRLSGPKQPVSPLDADMKHEASGKKMPRLHWTLSSDFGSVM